MTHSPSILLLAQVDHACGDIIASVTEELITLGVQNVNLVPSLTKKGRPGYLLFLDLPETLLVQVERVLATELGILGWRTFSAEHRGPKVSPVQRQVTLSLGGEEHVLDVPAKLVETADGSGVALVEHDFCVRLKRELRDAHGVDIPIRVLKARIQGLVSELLDDRAKGTVPERREKEV